MRGIVRPCAQHLGPALHARWQAHLCGLCLTLRDAVGQPERLLTGYDVLLLSVLVEAQSGPVETTEAAPCPLRGFTRATVVASSSPAGRLAAAGAVVSAEAGVADKLADGDLPSALRSTARHVQARLHRAGSALSAEVGLDPTFVRQAPQASAAAERDDAQTLEGLLAPTGEAVASLFAHTAAVAGRPGNAGPLAACGRAFGQLVHLLDAVHDLDADALAGRFNPLLATGTDAAAARQLAHGLVARAQRALDQVALVDRELVDVLLGRELARAVERVLPEPTPPSTRTTTSAVPVQRTRRAPVLAPLVAVWTLLLNAVIIGGSWGGGRRRRRRYEGYPPGYGPGYGYRRTGPGCGQLLACNCCANLACNACCCGSSCASS